MSGPTVISKLRHRRTDAGLSQAELAQSVGVTRQALIAIEAGRQVPSTMLSLQLARALHCGVEDLFTLATIPSIHASLAAPSAMDSRVVVGLIDGAWAAHPVADDARAADGLLVGQAAANTATIEPLIDLAELGQNVLVAGCAPLLGIAAGQLGRRFSDARATWVPANSGRSLDLLERGLVHVAGMHLVDAQEDGGHEEIVRARFPDHDSVIVNLTRWRQGLVVAKGNPLGIAGVQDLLRPDVRVCTREAGAAAQQLLERLLPGDDLSAVALASGHAEVAQLVRWGVADVGIAIEAAALAEGLDFIPLSEERFDLIVPRTRLETPSVSRLLELIDRPSFRAEGGRLRGYDLSTAGHSTTVAVGQE